MWKYVFSITILVSVIHNIFNFDSWPIKSKVFTIWLFQEMFDDSLFYIMAFPQLLFTIVICTAISPKYTSFSKGKPQNAFNKVGLKLQDCGLRRYFKLSCYHNPSNIMNNFNLNRGHLDECQINSQSKYQTRTS